MPHRLVGKIKGMVCFQDAGQSIAAGEYTMSWNQQGLVEQRTRRTMEANKTGNVGICFEMLITRRPDLFSWAHLSRQVTQSVRMVPISLTLNSSCEIYEQIK